MDITGLPPEEGSLFLRWNAVVQSYQTNRFIRGGWLFSEPVAAVGEGVVIWLPHGTLPVISDPPLSQVATQGQTVTFTVSASGSAPLQYHWIFCPKPNWDQPTNVLSVSGAMLTLSNCNRPMRVIILRW